MAARDAAVGWEPGAAPPTVQVVADIIRTQILSGALRPGDQLPTEGDLSSHYKVGRNTAREALRLLASEGLLVTKRGLGGGVFVAVPSAKHISTTLLTSLTVRVQHAEIPVSVLMEMRFLLEVPAAGLAATRATDEQIAELRQSVINLQSVVPEVGFASNRAFHGGILRAAHNPLLEIIAEPMFMVLHRRLEIGPVSGRFWRHVRGAHRDILACIEERDASGAQQAARAHLEYLEGSYSRLERRKAE